jgi:hypothetical protein
VAVEVRLTGGAFARASPPPSPPGVEGEEAPPPPPPPAVPGAPLVVRRARGVAVGGAARRERERRRRSARALTATARLRARADEAGPRTQRGRRCPRAAARAACGVRARARLHALRLTLLRLRAARLLPLRLRDAPQQALARALRASLTDFAAAQSGAAVRGVATTDVALKARDARPTAVAARARSKTAHFAPGRALSHAACSHAVPRRPDAAPPRRATQSWPPCEGVAGVIVLTALIDHGHGTDAKRAASALAHACGGDGSTARAALLAALAAASPRGLHVEDLSLVLVSLDTAAPHLRRHSQSGESSIRGRRNSNSGAAPFSGEPSLDDHPSAAAAAALEAMGGGTFAPDELMDGSVRGGAARGSDRAADALARAEAKAEMEGQ